MSISSINNTQGLTIQKLESIQPNKYLVRYTQGGKTAWGAASRSLGESVVERLPNIFKKGLFERFVMVVAGPSKQELEDRKAAVERLKELFTINQTDVLQNNALTISQAKKILAEQKNAPQPNAKTSALNTDYNCEALDLSVLIEPQVLNTIYEQLRSAPEQLNCKPIQVDDQVFEIRDSLYNDLHRGKFIVTDSQSCDSGMDLALTSPTGVSPETARQVFTQKIIKQLADQGANQQQIHTALKDLSMIIHQGIFADLSLMPYFKKHPNMLPLAQSGGNEACIKYIFNFQTDGSILITASNYDKLEGIMDGSKLIEANTEKSFSCSTLKIKFTPAYLCNDNKPNFEVLSSVYDRTLIPK